MNSADQLKGIDPLQLAHERPEMSACVPMTRTQKLIMYGTLILVLAGMAVRPWQIARIFVFCSTVFYLIFTLYKLMLVRMSVVTDSQIHISKKELSSVSDEELPVYSVLVPMYLEPESLAQIVESLEKMDYPADKKDVQFLLEEDDEATLKEAARVSMPQGFSVTVVPESFPRTKPKACNFGLVKENIR